MNNNELYDSAFVEVFEIEKETLSGLEFESIDEWDSVGHMELMACLEETFDIMLDMDDILDFSSYEKGKQICKKYGVEVA